MNLQEICSHLDTCGTTGGLMNVTSPLSLDKQPLVMPMSPKMRSNTSDMDIWDKHAWIHRWKVVETIAVKQLSCMKEMLRQKAWQSITAYLSIQLYSIDARTSAKMIHDDSAHPISAHPSQTLPFAAMMLGPSSSRRKRAPSFAPKC